MSNLIEVVFEDVAKSCVKKLLSLLIPSFEGVLGVDCSENISVFEGNEISDKGIESFLSFDGDVAILVDVEAMKLESLILPRVQLRLMKYGNQCDIDFNFNSNELKNISTATLIKQLHAYVKKLAVNCNVSSFFGGMEPASDEDTRYFTNEELGPLVV